MELTNYYRLSKAQLSRISYVERPIVSERTGQRLSRPVVLEINPISRTVVNVFSLVWYKKRCKRGSLLDNFIYEIHALY